MACQEPVQSGEDELLVEGWMVGESIVGVHAGEAIVGVHAGVVGVQSGLGFALPVELQ